MNNSSKKELLIVGLGGFGAQYVKYASEAGMFEHAEFCTIDTDQFALKRVSDRTDIDILQIGQSVTHGLGCGAKPERGRMIAEKEVHQIMEFFLKRKPQMIILVFALAGGLGGGAAPTFVNHLIESECSFRVVCTAPFPFEGSRRTKMAEDALSQLKLQTNRVTVVQPNSSKLFTEVMYDVDNAIYSVLS